MDRRIFLQNAAACGGVTLLGSLAGCAQGSDDTTTRATGGTTTQETSTPTESATATVVVSSTETLGDILTDSEGMTLYLFTKDNPDESVCYDGCAKNWPPLIADAPSAGGDVLAQLGTVKRKDGSMHVTVADHPLYYYVGDTNPGDTTGQGLGNVWFVVGPDGQKKTTSPTTTTATTTEDSSGYGGY